MKRGDSALKLPLMDFFDGEAAADAVASYAALLSIRSHRFHVQLCRFGGVAADAGAHNRLKRFDGAVRLRNQRR